jgi:hypothetical protein
MTKFAAISEFSTVSPISWTASRDPRCRFSEQYELNRVDVALNDQGLIGAGSREAIAWDTGLARG